MDNLATLLGAFIGLAILQAFTNDAKMWPTICAILSPQGP